DHCLVDLLYRWKAKEFDIEIPCVISNHADLRSYVEWHGIPYHHIPVMPETKIQAYNEVMQRIDEVAADVIVLARYMQILSP
ncbi:formyltransferase family protein, partial [Acinetobacter baumannii]